MRGAILNPIRFLKPSERPDYINHFQNPYNAPIGESYTYGINASPDSIIKHVGVMNLQFIMDGSNPNVVKSIHVYKLNEDGTFENTEDISTINISPEGWIGYQIHSLELDLDEGIYYCILDDFKSDIFEIVEEGEDLIQIIYSHSENKYGCIFTEAEFTEFTAYFRGQLIQGELKNDLTVFEQDPSGIIKLNATPEIMFTINLIGISYVYANLVNHIFSLDTIYVNGILCQNEDAPSWSMVEGSDIGTISIKLTQTINDYYYGQ